MYTLRCTAKLLKRLGPPVEGTGEPPTNRLGDWYATLVHAPRMHLVLMVSERTLLPVVVPAREASTFLERAPTALAEVLLGLSVRPSVIEQELAAMAGASIGRTTNCSPGRPDWGVSVWRDGGGAPWPVIPEG